MVNPPQWQHSRRDLPIGHVIELSPVYGPDGTQIGLSVGFQIDHAPLPPRLSRWARLQLMAWFYIGRARRWVLRFLHA